jgi:hypothetical protein
VLDLIMQGLWTKTQGSTLEAPYFSCVPYLLGEGQAMEYSVWPTSKRKTPIPRLPFRPPDDYLRNAMAATLAAGDVELDFRIQRQTDPHLMPIENAGVLWPERLSPRVSVATLRLPRQTFTSQAQMDFARRLSYNPWHSIPEHRPLGNQSRARRRMYYELSKLRHTMNAVPHQEPREVYEFVVAMTRSPVSSSWPRSHASGSRTARLLDAMNEAPGLEAVGGAIPFSTPPQAAPRAPASRGRQDGRR